MQVSCRRISNEAFKRAPRQIARHDRERTVKFSLPPIEAARTGQSWGPSPHDVSQPMDAVTSALARGEITPGEAETIAGVVDTFVRAIETTQEGWLSFQSAADFAGGRRR
jgi:hypothetical protein